MNTLAAVTDDDSLTERYTKDDPPPRGSVGHDFDLKEELDDMRGHVRERVTKLEVFLSDLPKILK